MDERLKLIDDPLGAADLPNMGAADVLFVCLSRDCFVNEHAREMIRAMRERSRLRDTVRLLLVQVR